jgi:hypothetical protein
MTYQLLEEYFDTPLFQTAVQEYFDTVLAALFADHSLTETKGQFVYDGGKKKTDYFDMPYPVHILNGLIPALHIFEQFLKNAGQADSPETVTWLKVFMLGFTLHDANKLLRVPEQKGKTDLELALEQLQEDVANFRVTEFFPEFEKYKDKVFHLALATENRTRILANEYAAERFVREKLAPLCHLADGLASVQEVESPASVFEAIRWKVAEVERFFGAMPLSYVEVRPNPYVLTNQKLLQAARRVLHGNGKKVLFSLRTGFVFFGEDATPEERTAIQQTFLGSSDLDPVGLTKVNFQKCEFGFLGSVPFTPEVLDKICERLQPSFLELSPNSREKIRDFDGFFEFVKKFLTAFSPFDEWLNPELDSKTRNKLYLRFAQRSDPEGDEMWFRKIFVLHKIQWLNTGKSKTWNADYECWSAAIAPEAKKSKKNAELQPQANIGLPEPFDYAGRTYATLADVVTLVNSSTNLPGYLTKNLLCLAKTWRVLFDGETDAEEYFQALQKDILETFQTSGKQSNTADTGFVERFFYCRGEEAKLLANYQPSIPEKSEMCLFSGAKSDKEYTESDAFGVKARGFSNRTVTALGNTASGISRWFKDENNLRISNFQQKEANYCLYADFFETSLDISRDIITACAKAKSKELKFVDGEAIEFDKNTRFQYNLFNLDFVSLAPKVKDVFWQVRRWLLMVKKLGLRAYVTGIMSPYTPHKAAFHFENAPAWMQSLGWHQVRLKNVEAVLEEMKLVILFGKDRVDSTLLQIATSRRAYFRLYYLLKTDDQKKVVAALTDFICNHPSHFNMTIIEQLVALALKIEVADRKSSGATETWLIRTATDLLRTYAKQERPRDEIIHKISGEIYRKMRREFVQDKLQTIENFAAGVYDLLFVEGWKSHLPTSNVQKDWIYEFAFVYKKQSNEMLNEFFRNKKDKGEQPATSIEP